MSHKVGNRRTKRAQSVLTEDDRRIVMLEEHPRPEWFVKVKTPAGETQWFTRISVTGLCVRRYGPFPSKRACLLFLDAAVNALIDGFMEVAEVQNKFAIPNRPFQNRGGQYPIVEREIVLHAKALGTTGSTPARKRSRGANTMQAA
ncbi:MAG: hypothetical protein NTNFB01_05360 [Nitrospira sp.]